MFPTYYALTAQRLFYDLLSILACKIGLDKWTGIYCFQIMYVDNDIESSYQQSDWIPELVGFNE